MKYVVDGIPIPLLRPRYSQGRRPWDSQREEKVKWGLNVERQHGTKSMYDGPVHLVVAFYFPFPKSMLKRAQSNPDQIVPHSYKPDLSNLIKFAEDAITGILYRDDCIIASVEAIKAYSLLPRTEFSLVPFDAYLAKGCTWTN